MKLQTEINGFTIILICSLLPLVSLAPTVTTEGKITTGQRHFTTRIKILASVLETQAMALFKNFSTCSSLTEQTKCWLMANSQARETVQAIPDCPAFEPNCCAFHVFFNTLKAFRDDVEEICDGIVTGAVNATLNQLQATLNEGAKVYTCRSEDLPRVALPQGKMRTAEKKTYIWWILHKYDQFMRATTKRYSLSSNMSG